MFDEVMEMIKKAGVFLVLAQTFLQLCAGDVYEKYIRMVIGLISAMLLFLPVLEWIREDGVQSFENYRVEYEEEMFGNETDFDAIRDEAWKSQLENSGSISFPLSEDF